MEWHNLRFSMGKREILKDITGVLEPGRIVGIMGPSGCGKTSLMNCLSGRQRSSGSSKGGNLSTSVEVTGTLSCRGQEMNPIHFQKMVAYVFQDSALSMMETPTDCLNFSAVLRLPASVSAQERATLVRGMLQRLNLESCANTIVGSFTRKGLSGGEQKRTAIGVELISKPKMIFLDEPLTGLDSYNAYTLMKTLRCLAESGVPVMLTLHQPSSEIFDMVDDLLLLHEGEVCYQGPTESLVGYLDMLGFPCEADYHPADKAMWIIQNEEPEEVRRVKDAWLQSGLHSELDEKMRRAALRSATMTELESEQAHTAIGTEVTETDEGSGSSFSSASASAVNEKQVAGTKNCSCCSNGRRTQEKGCCTTLSALLARDLRRNCRNLVQFLSTYVLMQFVVALSYSVLFWGKGREEFDGRCDATGPEFNRMLCTSSFKSHFGFLGLMGWVIVNSTMPFAIDTLQSERSVFLRERSGGYYGAFVYFASKTVYEIPLIALEACAALLGTYWFVGLQGNFFLLLLELEILALASSSTMFVFSAGCSSPEKAGSYAAFPVMMQFAFAGVLLPVSQIPLALRWIRWLCPMYYGLSILGTTEFAYIGRGLAQCQAEHYGSVPMPEGGGLCSGWVARDEELREYGVNADKFWWPNIAMCCVIFVAFRTVAVILLWRNSRYVH